jgi:NAD-dependent SIR2 family protein deacetylase
VTRLCPKCQQVVESTLVAESGGVEFRRCDACQGMATFRAQEPRGQVVRVGEVLWTSEAVGVIEGREHLEPNWYQAALARGA